MRWDLIDGVVKAARRMVNDGMSEARWHDIRRAFDRFDAAKETAALLGAGGLPATDRVLRDIAMERRRQIAIEGFSIAHDDEHEDGSLASAAACYVRFASGDQALVQHHNPEPDARDCFFLPPGWPPSWSPDWWRPKDARRNLIKAGALIAAEIERIDRADNRALDGDPGDDA